ncbi:MAG: hypothetical protein V1702_04810 [Candidatus Woesearchaeota archaeon]
MGIEATVLEIQGKVLKLEIVDGKTAITVETADRSIQRVLADPMGWRQREALVGKDIIYSCNPEGRVTYFVLPKVTMPYRVIRTGELVEALA